MADTAVYLNFLKELDKFPNIWPVVEAFEEAAQPTPKNTLVTSYLFSVLRNGMVYSLVIRGNVLQITIEEMEGGRPRSVLDAYISKNGNTDVRVEKNKKYGDDILKITNAIKIFEGVVKGGRSGSR